MPKKCCADLCKTNYESTTKKRKKCSKSNEPRDVNCRVFSFPKDSVRRIAWINALPNVIHNITDYMGVCEKHWPPNFPTVRVKGHDLPRDPPSIWSVPDSFCRQLKSPVRDIKKRGIDSESRRNVVDAAGEIEIEPDRIKNWDSLVTFCQGIGLPLTVMEESIVLFRCNGLPPKIDFSVTINRDYSLSCYRRATYVSTRELVGGFSGKLELFSQLTHVIDKVKTYTVDVNSELKSCKKDLNDLIRDSEIEGKQKTQLEFLCEQLNMHCYKTEGRRYNTDTIHKAIELYIKSRNSYRYLRDTLILPHEDTIKSYFGKIGTPGIEPFILFLLIIFVIWIILLGELGP